MRRHWTQPGKFQGRNLKKKKREKKKEKAHITGFHIKAQWFTLSPATARFNLDCTVVAYVFVWAFYDSPCSESWRSLSDTPGHISQTRAELTVFLETSATKLGIKQIICAVQLRPAPLGNQPSTLATASTAAETMKKSRLTSNRPAQPHLTVSRMLNHCPRMLAGTWTWPQSGLLTEVPLRIPYTVFKWSFA